MKKFAIFDNDGRPEAFYSEDIHRTYKKEEVAVVDHETGKPIFDEATKKPITTTKTTLIDDKIPAEAIEITNEDWQEFISNHGVRKWHQGHVIICDPPAVNWTWDAIRVRRNHFLSESDWTQVSDSPLSTELKEAWGLYRQQLRDITETFSNPSDIVWPKQPQ